MQKTGNLLLEFLAVLLFSAIRMNADWPMTAHDPQRTSCSTESIGICSNFVWCKPMYYWMPERSHMITVEGTGGNPDMLYVATSTGIYALDPSNGAEKWVYSMDLPPGDSPTVVNNVLYVGGTDKTLHAVNAITGAKIWQTDMAGAAFYCNPLVVNNKVYAGSRDGNFYCFNANDGSYLWHYKTGGPISVSAAYQVYPDYPNGVVFFASRDNYVYALKADTGALVWRSPEIYCLGMMTFWPVVAGDRVLIVASEMYPGGGDLTLDIFYFKPVMYHGAAEIQSHTDAQGWLDLSNHVNHLNAYPQRKTFYVLDRNTGLEAETSPIFVQGNMGTRYPAAIALGQSNLVYAKMPIDGGSWYTEGEWAGWQMGTPKVKRVGGSDSNDETECQSIIGNYIYYNEGGDGYDHGGYRSLIDGTGADLWSGTSLNSLHPNYNQYMQDRKYGNNPVYNNGPTSYGWESNQNPPVPLKGKVYCNRSCAVICFSQ